MHGRIPSPPDVDNALATSSIACTARRQLCVARVMKRHLLTTIALFSFVPPIAAQEQPQSLQVSVVRANVRDAASMNGEVIFQLSQNDVLTVLDKSDDWYFVETSTGRRGYIHTSVVRVVTRQPISPAQPGAAPPRADFNPSSGPNVLWNVDIIAMAKAGLGNDIIVGAVRNAQSTQFDLTPAGLVNLKNGGVTDAVIRFMLDGLKTASPSPTPEDTPAKPAAASSSTPPTLPQAQVQTPSPVSGPTNPLNRARPAVFGGFVAGGGEALFAFGGGVGGRPLRNYRNLGIFGDLAFAHSDDVEAWLTLIGAGAVQNFQLEGENIVPYAGAGVTLAVANTAFGSFEDAAFHISGGVDFPVRQNRLFRVDVRFMFFEQTVTRVLGAFVF